MITLQLSQLNNLIGKSFDNIKKSLVETIVTKMTSKTLDFSDPKKFDKEYTFEVILDYIKKKEANSTTKPQIYFGGNDSSDTKFQKQSNNLEIGIIANLNETAIAMLALLREIVNI